MDQSLFTCFVRLDVPYIKLNAQGRARPTIGKLYNWRYRELRDLPYVREEAMFQNANAGFSYEYQVVDVPDFMGKGESAPSSWFYQNVGEAEYIVSVYIYMRSLGYPVSKISILTTYNGQKILIPDVISRRCKAYGIERPSKMQMMNQYRPVEELLDNQNGTDEMGPTENGVEDVEMPLAFSGEPEPKPKPKPESEAEPESELIPKTESEPDSGNIAQEDDASANDSKMEE